MNQEKKVQSLWIEITHSDAVSFRCVRHAGFAKSRERKKYLDLIDLKTPTNPPFLFPFPPFFLPFL
jgi:hypothetical protein